MTNEQTDTNDTRLLATVDRMDLKKAAMNLKKIAPRKSSLPVLKLAKVDTRGGELRLTVTDLDVSLVLTLDGADVAHEGVASADPRELKKVLTNTSAERVELYAEDETPGLILRAGGVEFTFQGYDEDEFPELPDVEGTEGTVRLPVDLWSDYSDRMTPFVSTEDSRPILNGVLFQHDGAGLNVVATNGHRMMIHQDTCYGEAFSAILPGRECLKPLRLILKRAGVDRESYGRMDVDENHARISFPGVTVYTRLITGPYPKWQQVVPRDADMAGSVTLDREDLLEKVKTLNVAASDQTHRTRWNLAQGETPTVHADAPDGPSAETGLGGTYRGEDMEIGFNAEYLIDILKAHTADNVELRVRAPERAAMIEPETADGWRSLLMPLRVHD